MRRYSLLLKDFFLKETDDLGKVCIYRADINTSVDARGYPQDSPKFAIYAQQLKHLMKVSPRTGFVLLTHNGRPKDDEYISLIHHAKILREKYSLNISFCGEVPYGSEVVERMEALRPGEILLLENTRFDVDWELRTVNWEDQRRHSVTQLLVSHADSFINDAYPSIHRGHTSLVGFYNLLPFYFGFYVQDEVAKTEKLIGKMRRAERICFCIGGKKFKLEYHRSLMELFPQILLLTAGIPGQAMLYAFGHRLNREGEEFIKREENMKNIMMAEKLVEKFGRERIRHPVDFFLKKGSKVIYAPLERLPRVEGEIVDIGPDTVQLYTQEFNRAEVNILAGPPGMCDRGFGYGTKGLLYGTKNLNVFGGHGTASLPIGLEWEEMSKVADYSIAGGAKLAHITGQDLPSFDILIKT